MRNPRNDTADGIADRSPAKARVQPGKEKPGLLPSQEHSHTPERTCVLTRRKATKDALIRLALGPDGEVAPDVRARAPGRGAWIGVGRGQLDAANAKGELKAALQRAFKTKDIQVPGNLGERIEHALRKTALDRLGMEARAKTLITGADKVEAAARGGQVHLLLHALDASEDGRKRMDQAWRVGGGKPRGMIFPEGRTILSMALGRENVVHVALIDPAAATRVRHVLGRWQAFTDPSPGLEGGAPASGPGSADELTKE